MPGIALVPFEAVDRWLILERPHTALADMPKMRADAAQTIGVSEHSLKSFGHITKATTHLQNGLELKGQSSRYLLARSANVWAKLVAGFYVKPRYLTTVHQSEFWDEIMRASCDIEDSIKVELAYTAENITTTDILLASTHALQIALHPMEFMREYVKDHVLLMIKM